MDIEKIATSYFNDAISMCNKLKSNVTEDDKGISIDGYVTIFNDNNYSKKNLIGRVDVQVKGYLTKISSTLTYPISVDDLNVYRNYGGCVYIVVEIDGDKRKIFYKTISTEFIKTLNNKIISGQKSINIKLDVFPTSTNDIEDLFLNTFKDFEKQNPFKNLPPLYINQIKEKGTITISNYSFHNENKNINKILLGNNFPLYFKSENEKLEQPIAGLNKIESITYHDKFPISIENIKYYDGCTRILKKDQMIINIGKSFSFIFNEKEKNIVHYNIKFDNHILDLINDSKFIINWIKYKYFDVEFKDGKKRIPINSEIKLDLKFIESRMNDCIKIKQVLNNLDYFDNFDMSILTETDYNRLDSLYSSVINNEILNFDNYIYNPIGIFKINNIVLLLYVEKVEENKYKIHNISKLNGELKLKWDNGKEEEITPYSLLDSDTLSKISNLNTKDIFNKFTSVSNNNDINNFATQLISAYDINNRKELLDLAKKLLEWNLNFNLDETLFEYSKLNLLQINERLLHSFSKNDIDYLNTIIYNSKYNSYLKCAALLLLKDKEKFNVEFTKLTDIEKKEFANFPKYKHYINLLS